MEWARHKTGESKDSVGKWDQRRWCSERHYLNSTRGSTARGREWEHCTNEGDHREQNWVVWVRVAHLGCGVSNRKDATKIEVK